MPHATSATALYNSITFNSLFEMQQLLDLLGWQYNNVLFQFSI